MDRRAARLLLLAAFASAEFVLLTDSCRTASAAFVGAECPALVTTLASPSNFTACLNLRRGCIGTSLLATNASPTPPESDCRMCLSPPTCNWRATISALTTGVLTGAVTGCASESDRVALLYFREQVQTVCNRMTTPSNREGYMSMTRLDQCGNGCGLRRCAPGVYCPGGNVSPSLCPPGFYCPTSTERLPCPSGKYCPEGTVDPVTCVGGAVCLEGSSRPINVGFLIIAVILLSLTAFGMALLERRRSVKEAAQLSLGKRGGNAALIAAGVMAEGGSKGGSSQSVQGGGAHASQAHSRAGVLIEFSALRLVTRGVVRLAGVSGAIQPGRLTAIMGGSGAGKTTLMNALLGKEAKSGGQVNITVVRSVQSESVSPVADGVVPDQVNPMTRVSSATVTPSPPGQTTVPGWTPLGTLQQHELKYNLGFVPQTDILTRELTVRECLLHAARTRLPASTPDALVQASVDRTLADLGLVHVAHTLVGSAEEALSGGGLSGGERKRVSIGTELVSDPLVLVLDEPTTGLDATAALECMETVKSAAERGITCMAVLHQPRQEIVDLCDDIIVLARGGRPVFSGPTALLLPYFTQLGYHCPSDTNPCDFVLDAVNGKHGDPVPTGGRAFVKAKQAASAGAEVVLSSQTSPSLAGIAPPSFADFTAAWEGGGLEWVRSHAAQVGAAITITASNGSGSSSSSSGALTETGAHTRPNFFVCTWLYFRRAVLQKLRSNSLLLDCVAMLLGGCLMGVVAASGPLFAPPPPQMYWRACPPGAGGACQWARRYFIAPAGFYIAMVSGSLSVPAAVRAFGTEREVLWREAGVGANRPAYFLGKLAAELPVYLLLAMAFTAPLAAIAAFRAPVHLLYTCVLMCMVVVSAIGNCLAIVMSNPDGASLIGVLIAILMNLFNGTYAPDVPAAVLPLCISHSFPPFLPLYSMQASCQG